MKKLSKHYRKSDKLSNITFVQGHRYLIDHKEYICARVGGKDYRHPQFALINLVNGNRWQDPVENIQDIAKYCHYPIREVR